MEVDTLSLLRDLNEIEMNISTTEVISMIGGDRLDLFAYTLFSANRNY